MDKKDTLAKFKRASDMLHESGLVLTILRYAQSGHATELMIEQAIVMVDKHIAWAKEDNDQSSLTSAVSLKEGLEKALRDGIESLRYVQGPGPEIIYVENPVANSRVALGHKIRRQMRCAGGVIDIYDLTADELIECKHRGTSAALGEAAGQLARYRKSFPGARLIIAVLSIEPEAQWLADVLRQQGIIITEVGKACEQ